MSSRCFVLSLLAFGSFASLALAADEAKKPMNYREATENCEKAIERRKHELAGEYSSEVWSLKDKFQKAGDLEKALAADAEWTRSLARKPLDRAHLVEFPPELRKLQEHFMQRCDTIVETAASEFLQELQKEAAAIAKAGKLADGRILQQEIDTIKKLYLGGRDASPRASGVAEAIAEGDVIAACEEALRQKRVAVQAQYVGALEALEKSFQAKGALEDLFAAKAERKRFMETPLLPDENLVELPEALRELQEKYQELQHNVTVSVAEEFIARLEQEKKALTIAGKLEEAVKAKSDAEQILRKYALQADAAAGDSSPKDGLVAFYTFEESGKDMSGNGRDLKIGNQTWVDGVGKGKAIHFKYNSAMPIPNSAQLCLEPFSVAAWIRLDEQASLAGKWPHALGKRVDFNKGTVSIFCHPRGEPFGCHANFQDGSYADLRAKSAMTAGKWYHVVLSFSGEEVAFFVDGKEVARQQAPVKLLQSESPFIIGGNGWVGPEQTWQGDIDNVRLYSRELRRGEAVKIFEKERQRR